MTEARLADLGGRLKAVSTWIWNRDDVRFIAHCVFLLGLVMWIRPMFQSGPPHSAYEEASVSGRCCGTISIS